MMKDMDLSFGFNFSRLGSNGWNNFSFDDNSRSISVLPRFNNNSVQPNQNSLNTHSLRLQSLLNQPPRPPASIYNCLESDQDEQGDIREVDYLPNEPEAKHVNSKQYFRMMKRRIKKVMDQYKRSEQKGSCEGLEESSPNSKNRKKYLYESRHLHAQRRVRGKDGKFLATRPQSQRFRQKKKRGRKPKNKVTDNNTAQIACQA